MQAGETTFEQRVPTHVPPGQSKSMREKPSVGVTTRARGGLESAVERVVPARVLRSSVLPVSVMAALGIGSLLHLIGAALSIKSPAPLLLQPPATSILKIIGSAFILLAGLAAPGAQLVFRRVFPSPEAARMGWVNYVPRRIHQACQMAWPPLTVLSGTLLLAASIISVVVGTQARHALVTGLTQGTGKLASIFPENVIHALKIGSPAANTALGTLTGPPLVHIAQEVAWRLGVVAFAGAILCKVVAQFPFTGPYEVDRIRVRGDTIVKGITRTGEGRIGVDTGADVMGTNVQRPLWGMSRDNWVTIAKACEWFAGLCGLLAPFFMVLGALAMATVPIGGIINYARHYARHGNDLPFDWMGRIKPSMLHHTVPRLLSRFVDVSLRSPLEAVTGGASTKIPGLTPTTSSTVGGADSAFNVVDQAVSQGLLPGPNIWLTSANGTFLLGVLLTALSWGLGHLTKFCLVKGARMRDTIGPLNVLGLPPARQRTE